MCETSELSVIGAKICRDCAMKLFKWSLGGVEHDRRRQCTGRVENHALILLVQVAANMRLAWGGGMKAEVGNWRW